MKTNGREMLTLAAIIGIAVPSMADTLYFSGGSSTTWDTTTLNWGTVSGGPYTASAWGTAGNNAVFEGTGAAFLGLAKAASRGIPHLPRHSTAGATAGATALQNNRRAL